MPAFLYLLGGELRRHARAPWVASFVVVVVAAGSISILLRGRDLLEHQAAYEDLLQTRVQAQVRAKSVVLGRSTETALRVVREPNRGALLVRGHDPTLPAAWDVAPAGAEALAPYSLVSRGQDLGGVWDQDVLLRVVGGLFAAALGLVTAFRDRTSGWSAAARALPVSATKMTAARFGGGVIALCLAAAIWWGTLAAVLAGDSESSLPPLLYVFLWLTSSAFLFVLFSAGFTVGTLARSTFRGVLTGMVFWFALSVAGPAVTLLVSEFASPSESRVRFERERQEQYADLIDSADRALAISLGNRLQPSLTPALLDETGTRVFHELEPAWHKQIFDARDEIERLERQWVGGLEHRRRLARWAAWASPGAVTRELLAELAGTGRGETQRWESEAAVFQRALNLAVFDNRPKLSLRVPVGDVEFVMSFDRHPPKALTDLPSFELLPSTVQDRLFASAGEAAALALWCLAAAVGALVLGSRYRSLAEY